MIDLQQVQVELNGARRARLAAETAEHEIETLILDMQSEAWSRLALVDALADETYDPHLFKRAH
ncbi:MAG: hypothetical protein WDO17_00960 [Alphaproteobacteria bacterium]